MLLELLKCFVIFGLNPTSFVKAHLLPSTLGSILVKQTELDNLELQLSYSSNNLTVVDYYDENTYARDLLAEAIKAGKLSNGSSPAVKPDESYTITPISTALQLGNNLSAGQETTEYLYYKGKLSGFTNTKYGNCYITDDAGNKIYVYGLNDENGNIYESMDNKPKDGDTVIICSMIKKYKYTSGDTLVELINSVVVAINP